MNGMKACSCFNKAVSPASHLGKKNAILEKSLSRLSGLGTHVWLGVECNRLNLRKSKKKQF